MPFVNSTVMFWCQFYDQSSYAINCRPEIEFDTGIVICVYLHRCLCLYVHMLLGSLYLLTTTLSVIRIALVLLIHQCGWIPVQQLSVSI